WHTIVERTHAWILKERKENSRPAGKAQKRLGRWLILWLGRILAIVDLLVYCVCHKVIAYVYLHVVDARHPIDVVPDVLRYLETKDSGTKRACQVQVHVYLSRVDVNLVYELKLHYRYADLRVNYLGQLVKDLSASLLQLLFLTHSTISTSTIFNYCRKSEEKDVRALVL